MTETMMVRGIYNTEQNFVLKQNQLIEIFPFLPEFNTSNIFWLEFLGEGGSGSVKKAYNKQECEFIAIKTFNNVKELNQKDWANIMLEHDMLQAIEQIRSSQKENEQYFLKYGGVFREEGNPNSLILQMENGLVSLEDILRAGKSYTCAELMYVHRKLTEGFVLLQENGIANRDVKPGNIILVENPSKEGNFQYKISDFGIACKLDKGICDVPATEISGLTREYAAPEVLLFNEKVISENDTYNPFLADVFSFGVLTLKMINGKIKRKDLVSGKHLSPENIAGYEPIIDLLVGMLQENPDSRWDFKKILEFHRIIEKKYTESRPTDEGEYAHKFQIEIKEKKMENTAEDLEKLFDEHRNMYNSYGKYVTRPEGEKFHLKRALDILDKLLEKLTEDEEKKIKFQINKLSCELRIGIWERKMGNLKAAEEKLNQLQKKIENFNLNNGQLISKNEIQIKEIEADLLGNFGQLYENMGNLSKAEDFYLRSLEIKQKIFGETHSDVALSLKTLGTLYQNMGNRPKAEEFFLRSLKIHQNSKETDPDVSNSLKDLGTFWEENMNKKNPPNEKESQVISSLNINQKPFGQNIPDFADPLKILGSLFESMKGLPNAEGFHSNFESSLNNLETLHKKFQTNLELHHLLSLKIKQKTFGENHPEVAQSLKDLGQVYINMGDLPKAEKVHLRSLKIRQNIFGENHSEVASSFQNLGNLYEQMGKLPKAEEFHLRSLKINQNLFGENHSDVAISLKNLGDLYKNMGNLPKAEEFQLRSLKIRQNLIGEKNSDSLNNTGRKRRLNE